jgi:Tfp pilus assembly protein PilN
MREYKYKDSVYTVKENNLKQLRILQPLKNELARLSFESTKGIDRKILLQYQLKLRQLNLDIARMKERKEDFTAKEQELKELIEQYETDSEVATLNNFIESQNESVMLDRNKMLALILSVIATFLMK